MSFNREATADRILRECKGRPRKVQDVLCKGAQVHATLHLANVLDEHLDRISYQISGLREDLREVLRSLNKEGRAP